MAELPRGVWGHAYIVMITIFLGGAGRFDGGGWGGGGSFYPSNALDRTLDCHLFISPFRVF